MSTHNLDDVAGAYLQTHNAFQRLTFLLERKGSITVQELAMIYGEDPAQAVPLVRAEAGSERAEDAEGCSHIAHTDSETFANKGIQARAVDTRTSARDSAVARQPMSKAKAAGSYKRALDALTPIHPWRMYGITEFVRCLRAEAAAWRRQARTAEREVELLKIELEEVRRGAHE
jgi:hypothetical protein